MKINSINYLTISSQSEGTVGSLETPPSHVNQGSYETPPFIMYLIFAHSVNIKFFKVVFF